MRSMADQIENLETELAGLEDALAHCRRRRSQALADAETAPRLSGARAEANQIIGEAEREIPGLEREIERKGTALAALKRRADLMADPAFAAEIDARVAEAMKLRAALDKQLGAVAKATEKLAAELGKLSEIEAGLIQASPSFERSGAGRGSVRSWIMDTLSAYLGAGRIVFSDKPDRPGTGFTSPQMIEDGIRKAAAERADRIVRQRELAAGDAA